jgi:hypothetical protein
MIWVPANHLLLVHSTGTRIIPTFQLLKSPDPCMSLPLEIVDTQLSESAREEVSHGMGGTSPGRVICWHSCIERFTAFSIMEGLNAVWHRTSSQCSAIELKSAKTLVHDSAKLHGHGHQRRFLLFRARAQLRLCVTHDTAVAPRTIAMRPIVRVFPS